VKKAAGTLSISRGACLPTGKFSDHVKENALSLYQSKYGLPLVFIWTAIRPTSLPGSSLLRRYWRDKDNGGFRFNSINDLLNGAAVDTSSLRRSFQLHSIRPDLGIVQLRGNAVTRLRKLDEGEYDAIILAAAGVKRLGRGDRITETLSADISLAPLLPEF
jgi:hypothetical protein